ncbi:tRNA uracil 4-sulfurtransferase ThiI [Methanospirillum lacunae]|nr:tRNA uracil 4-sulfurtransferase ThiI [Methanospirillum lacunae]
MYEHSMENGKSGAVMIRFGELFLKSEPVRRQFMKVLIGNIRSALSSHEIEYSLVDNRSRIIVCSKTPEAMIPLLSHIFGIVDIAPALLTDSSLPALCDAAGKLASRNLKPGMSFAIRARRDQVPGFTSQELGAEAGGAVLESVPGVRVDLTHPDYEVYLEARKEGGLAYDIRIPGPGGLPYGTQGSVLSLISAGIDSPVASWMMMKRGVKVSFLYIDTGTWAGCDCTDNVLRNLAALSSWVPGISLSLHIVHAQPLYDLLMNDCEPRYRCVLCKRGMLMLAETFAAQRKIQAIVTGDNLGQVATQTLQNIVTISSSVAIPVLRPLIGYDKEDIISLARKIGTFTNNPGNTSCGVVPSKPATAADSSLIGDLEERLHMRSIIPSLLDNREKVIALNGKILSEFSKN